MAGTGGTYHFYNDGDGILSRSDIKYFRKGDITWGVPFDFTNVGKEEGININSLISVYPNPAEDRIVFHLKTPSDSTTPLLEIYSPTCKRITTIELSYPKTELNIAAFMRGIYLYRIAGGNVKGAGKFIKL